MLISRANVVSKIIACMSYGVFWPADVAKNLCCYFANRNLWHYLMDYYFCFMIIDIIATRFMQTWQKKIKMSNQTIATEDLTFGRIHHILTSSTRETQTIDSLFE